MFNSAQRLFLPHVAKKNLYCYFKGVTFEGYVITDVELFSRNNYKKQAGEKKKKNIKKNNTANVKSRYLFFEERS